jgi:hypothetical protein
MYGVCKSVIQNSPVTGNLLYSRSLRLTSLAQAGRQPDYVADGGWTACNPWGPESSYRGGHEKKPCWNKGNQVFDVVVPRKCQHGVKASLGVMSRNPPPCIAAERGANQGRTVLAYTLQEGSRRGNVTGPAVEEPRNECTLTLDSHQESRPTPGHALVQAASSQLLCWAHGERQGEG